MKSKIAKVQVENRALRKVYRAAQEWLDHLQGAGQGRYQDGVPGDLMDAIDEATAYVISRHAKDCRFMATFDNHPPEPCSCGYEPPLAAELDAREKDYDYALTIPRLKARVAELEGNQRHLWMCFDRLCPRCEQLRKDPAIRAALSGGKGEGQE